MPTLRAELRSAQRHNRNARAAPVHRYIAVTCGCNHWSPPLRSLAGVIDDVVIGADRLRSDMNDDSRSDTDHA
jgi:hypothetical protein